MLALIYRRMENLALASERNIFSGRFLKSSRKSSFCAEFVKIAKIRFYLPNFIFLPKTLKKFQKAVDQTTQWTKAIDEARVDRELSTDEKSHRHARRNPVTLDEVKNHQNRIETGQKIKGTSFLQNKKFS